MYTKARIAEHPIHPMLVAFPVALYVATVVALFVHVGTNDPFWYHMALWTNLAGVAMAIVAAVPGLVDLINLPTRSKARATGLRHAGFNVLALVLFTCSAAVLYRNFYHRPLLHLDDAAPIALGLVGLVATTAAGWLGWALVQTHHVGVKPTTHGSAIDQRSPEEIDDLDELVTTSASHSPYAHTLRH